LRNIQVIQYQPLYPLVLADDWLLGAFLCQCGTLGSGARALRGQGGAQVRLRLGDGGFAAVRAKVMAQQEVFVQQMYELHRVATRQRHLQTTCDRPAALRAEIALQVRARCQPPRPGQWRCPGAALRGAGGVLAWW